MDWTIDWHRTAVDVGRIVIAYVLALPIGWDREREERSLGVRTFPLVAMASCGYVLFGQMPGGDAGSRSRIIQGLITGIGFIGGGAILKTNGTVHGTATAASIWNTGVLGAAVALGRYDMAIALSLLNLLALRLLRPLKRRLDEGGNETERERP